METIVKRVSVQLVKEESHRYDVPKQLNSSETAAAFIREVINFDTVPCEMFVVVPVDTKNKPLAVSIVTKGIVNASIVHPREVFQPCILSNATACFVFHNHPSGDVSPSKEDKSITERLVIAGHILDIPVLDHIIIGDNYYSFRMEKGLNIKW